jgi:ATP-dependent DNA ligase
MNECVWLRPEVVARIEFLEWAGADHLRHTKFVGLRDDKVPLKVVRETWRAAVSTLLLFEVLRDAPVHVCRSMDCLQGLLQDVRGF